MIKHVATRTKFSADDNSNATLYADMKAFLEHPRVDVNLFTGDEEGLAPIHQAVDSRNAELIKLFLQCERINLNVKSKKVSALLCHTFDVY